MIAQGASGTLIVFSGEPEQHRMMHVDVTTQELEVVDRRHGTRVVMRTSLQEIVEAVDPEGTTWLRIG